MSGPLPIDNWPRVASTPNNLINFGLDLIYANVPFLFTTDKKPINQDSMYRAWILTMNCLNLWCGQFVEVTENEAFMDIEYHFFKDLFTYQRMVVMYREGQFELYHLVNPVPNNNKIEVRKVNTSLLYYHYDNITVDIDDVVIVSDNLVFSRWIWAFLSNFEITNLYGITYTTALAESKKFMLKIKSNNPEILEKMWLRFQSNQPWIINESIINSEEDLPNILTPMETGASTAPVMFDMLLKFQAFNAEMLGITQATDTKAERLTAGENIINTHNINVINTQILKGLKRFSRDVYNKWGVELKFELSNQLSQNINEGNQITHASNNQINP